MLNGCGFGGGNTAEADVKYNAYKFENFGDGYRYEVRVNDNPMLASEGLMVQLWSSAPLIRGENKIEIFIEKLSDDSILRFDLMEINGSDVRIIKSVREILDESRQTIRVNLQCDWIKEDLNDVVRTDFERSASDVIILDFWKNFSFIFLNQPEQKFLEKVFPNRIGIDSISAGTKDNRRFDVIENEHLDVIYGESMALLAPSFDALMNNKKFLVKSVGSTDQLQYNIRNILFIWDRGKWWLYSSNGSAEDLDYYWK